uniref:Putative ribosomal protein L7Ae/L30e/S12e/Gadd45 family protein n=1 Tax=uncultured marine crenarchaeote HF4000_APKG5C13 TaxID=455591 RepID=B3T8B2_9ARCH|nr:putative ribosomal protein L7Ae/L30e/S12e/Gadd45 family protein [uncultured marine crenarchaeote HF4000_APKG5C13]
MTKILEKAITDAIKERKSTLGAKQIVSSMKNSKLVIISQSVPTETAKKIEDSAQNINVPLIHFNDTSVILGKLCGLQFRVSAISLSSLSNTNVQAILKEYETK